MPGVPAVPAWLLPGCYACLCVCWLRRLPAAGCVTSRLAPLASSHLTQFHETLVAVKVLLDLEEAQKAAGPDAVWTLSNPILFNLQKVRCAALRCAPLCCAALPAPAGRLFAARLLGRHANLPARPSARLPTCRGFCPATTCVFPLLVLLLQECALMASLRHPNIVQVCQLDPLGYACRLACAGHCSAQM